MGTHWENNRRALNEDPNAPPSTADVVACEQDPETNTESDCGALVDEVFNYHILNAGQWHRAPAFPTQPTGHFVEAGESNSNAVDNGLRRRLFDLLQKQ